MDGHPLLAHPHSREQLLYLSKRTRGKAHGGGRGEVESKGTREAEPSVQWAQRPEGWRPDATWVLQLVARVLRAERTGKKDDQGMEVNSQGQGGRSAG